jgi:Peptidase inhibitor I78 family
MSAWVYNFDGTLQCDLGTEVSVAEARKQLAMLIGDESILAGEKRRVPMMFPAMCGAPTGMANVFQITEEGLYVLFHGFVGPMGFALWTWGDDKPNTVAKIAAAAPVLPWPFPLSKLANVNAKTDDAFVANLIASMTQVGSQPTTLAEIIGRRCRCYKQGDMLTMDYVPQRVNIELDAHSVIQRIWFG